MVAGHRAHGWILAGEADADHDDLLRRPAEGLGIWDIGAAGEVQGAPGSGERGKVAVKGPNQRSSSGEWCSKAAGSDVILATAGLMIVGLFQGSTKGEHHDGREGQDDRCPTCRQADE